jgi:hypothetical protein
MSATTIRSSCGVTVLVPECIRLRGPPKRPKPADLQSFQGVARPGLEPGTPRFSAACPAQANVIDLQRNRERVLGRRIREDSRNFVVIAPLLGTRSRTCAQMTYPPASAVIRTCGWLTRLPYPARLASRWAPVSDTDILDALRAYTREHGCVPTVTTCGTSTAGRARR